MIGLSAFLPVDRCHSLVQGLDLPEHASGVVLFADISGFTPLAEILSQKLGPSRGGEELTYYLNTVYEALITQVTLYGGSVISFSGDAITCWFEGELKATAHRVITLALIMQQTMDGLTKFSRFTTSAQKISIKVGIAAGSVRRFVVGDPILSNLIDILAGATIDRMVVAEQLARKGEVVVAPEVYNALSPLLEIGDWRQAEQCYYAVVTGIKQEAVASPWPMLHKELSPEQMRPWLIAAVYERITAGSGMFLTELRPVTALFLRFERLDYDNDPFVRDKLDAFVREVQRIIACYEGNILQLTIGDKGCYFYIAFGVPFAHENDVTRAARAALEISAIPTTSGLEWLTNLQIGISQGTARVGSYGSTTRHTYGALGDEINVAARLMQSALPGQILVTPTVQQQTASEFNWESLAPLQLKGKAAPLMVFRLISLKSKTGFRLQERDYKQPIIGRKEELALFKQIINKVMLKQGQVLSLIGEAGIGKSRLIAEFIRQAEVEHFEKYCGAAQSDGVNRNYLAWRPIWQKFFNLQLDQPQSAQVKQLEEELTGLGSAFLPLLPLLGNVVGLELPETFLSNSLSPSLRKENLEHLLLECLRIKASGRPLLLVLEDCHWLDPLSQDLLTLIANNLADLPVVLVLSYRPPELEINWTMALAGLPYFTLTHLQTFGPLEAIELVKYKLKELFAVELTNTDWQGALAILEAPSETETGLGDKKSQQASNLAWLMARAQGNPFYLEELLNFLHDKNIDVLNELALSNLDLPLSLQSLILSRLDRLAEDEKTLLKIASVIGRQFKVEWVRNVYPDTSELAGVTLPLEHLEKLEITLVERKEPELEYIFKHIITRDVAYESLPFATRELFHEQIGGYIERNYSSNLNHYIDLLAYHYERTTNQAKKQEYLKRAGLAAQAIYANSVALDYYQRLLLLLSEKKQQLEIKLKQAQLLEWIGRFKEAEEIYSESLQLAQHFEDIEQQAVALEGLGVVAWRQGNYPVARSFHETSLRLYQQLQHRSGIAASLHNLGNISWKQGQYELAWDFYQQGLQYYRELEDKLGMANSFYQLGVISQNLNKAGATEVYYQQGLELYREVGDKRGVSQVLLALGYSALARGDLELAWQLAQESLSLRREVGAKTGVASSLLGLALISYTGQDYLQAATRATQALILGRETGSKVIIAMSLANLVAIWAKSRTIATEKTVQLSSALKTLLETNKMTLDILARKLFEQAIMQVREELDQASFEAAWREGSMMKIEQVLSYALVNTASIQAETALTYKNN